MQAEHRRRPPIFNLLLPLAAGVLASACDIPTQAPAFDFSPTASAPVVFEKTFVFLGPDAAGTEALIDTTTATFDSIFSVNPTDGVVYVVQDLDDFDLVDIDGAIDPIGFEPEDIVVTIGGMADQQVRTSFDDRIGILEVDGGQTPTMAPLASAGAARLPLETGDLLTVPSNGVIDLTGADVERVTITQESGPDLNRLEFTLINGLDEDLTDGSSTPGAPPDVVLEAGATELARASFDRSPGPGQTAAAILDLVGLDVPSDGQFRLDISTPAGFSPIEAEPTRVGIDLTMRPVRYSRFELSNIPATAARSSRSSMTLDADVDFAGITTLDGYATIRITNTLPVPVRIQSLTVSTTADVGPFAAGHRVIEQGGPAIGPGTAIEVPAYIGANGVSRVVNAEVIATTQATPQPTEFTSDDGLEVSVSGDFSIDVLYYRPAGETFAATTDFTLEPGGLFFSGPSDYVEIESGTLDVTNLLNGIDVSFEDVTISFPGIRVSPYGPEDSLVVAFRGSADKANGREFAKIDRNAPPRNVAVDLSGVRISPTDGLVQYTVLARSETTNEVRAVAHDNTISGRAAATGLVIAGVSAFADPFSASLSDDVNGDGHLDPSVAGEGIESNLDDFGPLQQLNGLELAGAELSFNLTTSMAGDLVLYGILEGRDDLGNLVHLGGRGALAVSPADTILQSFRVSGEIPRADQMFALPLKVSGSVDRPSTHTVVLNDGNSNVSELASALPTSLRFVGKALIGSPPGGRLEITQPATLDVSVGVAIPMNLGGEFELARTEPADLSSLEGLTDPASTVTAESATMTLAYSNGIPLGLQARLQFLDETGSVTVSLPAETQESLELLPAVSDAEGYATAESHGEMEFGLADDDLRRLAASRDLRLAITFATPDESTGRIRASDSITLSLRGDFRFNVTVGQ